MRSPNDTDSTQVIASGSDRIEWSSRQGLPVRRVVRQLSTGRTRPGPSKDCSGSTRVAEDEASMSGRGYGDRSRRREPGARGPGFARSEPAAMLRSPVSAVCSAASVNGISMEWECEWKATINRRRSELARHGRGWPGTASASRLPPRQHRWRSPAGSRLAPDPSGDPCVGNAAARQRFHVVFLEDKQAVAQVGAAGARDAVAVGAAGPAPGPRPRRGTREPGRALPH